MSFILDTKAQTSLGASNPITLAYTCGATAKLLIVSIITKTTTARTGDDPTYNGDYMTQVGTTQAGSGECTSELWYLITPDTGSEYIINVPNTGTTDLRVMASSFICPYTVEFFGDIQTGTSSAAPPLTINTVPPNSLCVSVLGHGYRDAPIGRSHTTVYENDEGAWSSNTQYYLTTEEENVTMSWALGSSDDVAMIMVAFKDPPIFPTTGILDTFSDTENPMTGWTNLQNGIQSNGSQALVTVDGASNVSQWSTVFGADIEAYITIVNFGTVDEPWVFCIDSSYNGYAFASYAVDDDYRVHRIDGFTPTEVDTGAHDWTNGDSHGMYVTTGGTVYSYYKTGGGAWTLLDTTVEGTHTAKNYYVGLLANQDDARYDNFGGGVYVPPAPPAGVSRGFMTTMSKFWA